MPKFISKLCFFIKISLENIIFFTRNSKNFAQGYCWRIRTRAEVCGPGAGDRGQSLRRWNCWRKIWKVFRVLTLALGAGAKSEFVGYVEIVFGCYWWCFAGHLPISEFSKIGGEGFSDEQRKIVGFGLRQKILNRKDWIFKSISIFKIDFSNSSRILIRDQKIWNQRCRKPLNLDFRSKNKSIWTTKILILY